jgi:hypothetical protein
VAGTLGRHATRTEGRRHSRVELGVAAPLETCRVGRVPRHARSEQVRELRCLGLLQLCADLEAEAKDVALEWIDAAAQTLVEPEADPASLTERGQALESALRIAVSW